MPASFYDLNATLKSGQEYSFEQLQGKVVLIVNTASACGFTPQFQGLEQLYQKYKDQGLVILGFPSNTFFQEKSEDTVSECQLNYGVTFPLMKMSDVNGKNQNEVYAYLKQQKSGLLGLSAIKWNFEKFLVDQHGTVVDRYAMTTKPEAIAPKIENLLTKAKA